MFERNADAALRDGLPDQGAWNLFIVATANDTRLNDDERMALEKRDKRCSKWLRKLRAQRKVLEDALAHYPPL